MTEEQQSQTIESVLGVDPPRPEPESPPEPPSEQTPPQPQQESAEDTVTVPRDEFTKLSDHARYYEMIQEDPQARELIHDYYSAKVGRREMPRQQQQPEQGQPQEPPSDLTKAYQELRQEYDEAAQYLNTRLGQYEQMMTKLYIDNFELKNPDFAQYRDAALDLWNKAPSLGLEKAYSLAKAERGHTAPPSTGRPQEGPPVHPVVEGRGTGQIPDSEGELQRLMRNINDPKATPSWDELRSELAKGVDLIHKQKAV